MFDLDRLHARVAALRRKRLFFIGGAAKSGTSWLELLLDRHPQICCRGEGHFTNVLVPQILQVAEEYNKVLAWKNDVVFAELPSYPPLNEERQTYLWATAIALQLDAQCEGSTAKIIGEKTPDNVRSFALLHAAFPEARFIHIVRDGRDAAVSNWFHNMRVTPEWVTETYGTIDAFAEMFAGYWSGDLAAGTEFGLAHPDRYAVVRYEDLHADTRATLATLFEFLDVPTTSRVLAKCAEEGSFQRLSGGRAQGEEDRGSFFRKGTPGDWRNHMTPEAEARFRAVAGTWLRRFGYG
ncbi:MAG TPA: sulfotransferase [Stellaceae bacterium]|nr:sulfotransferase [Stellaceae bacterium]